VARMTRATPDRPRAARSGGGRGNEQAPSHSPSRVQGETPLRPSWPPEGVPRPVSCGPLRGEEFREHHLLLARVARRGKNSTPKQSGPTQLSVNRAGHRFRRGQGAGTQVRRPASCTVSAPLLEVAGSAGQNSGAHPTASRSTGWISCLETQKLPDESPRAPGAAGAGQGGLPGGL